MDGFSVTTAWDGSRAVLHLIGELDAAVAPLLLQAGTSALDDPRCEVLVLDGTALSFLDSSGVGCWLELRRAAGDHRRVEAVHLQPPVARVLDVTDLARLFSPDVAVEPVLDRPVVD